MVDRMKIAITGATGFLGKGLVRLIGSKGHNVIVLTRNRQLAEAAFGKKTKAVKWSTGNIDEMSRELDGVEAIVNLAGENIGSSFWTKEKRKKILESRLNSGALLTSLVSSMKQKPRLIVQGSAIGYYGSRGDVELSENSPKGAGFLADVVERWEDSTKELEASGIRRVIIRTGVVFAPHGGALPRLALPYRLHLGTIPGSGKQWVSWISYADEIEAIYFLMSRDSSSGIYNLASPEPARMEDICDAIAAAMDRRTIIRIPDILLKLSMRGMAEETILTSQKAFPSRLLSEGFRFLHANIRKSIGEFL